MWLCPLQQLQSVLRFFCKNFKIADWFARKPYYLRLHWSVMAMMQLIWLVNWNDLQFLELDPRGMHIINAHIVCWIGVLCNSLCIGGKMCHFCKQIYHEEHWVKPMDWRHVNEEINGNRCPMQVRNRKWLEQTVWPVVGEFRLSTSITCLDEFLDKLPWLRPPISSWD